MNIVKHLQKNFIRAIQMIQLPCLILFVTFTPISTLTAHPRSTKDSSQYYLPIIRNGSLGYYISTQGSDSNPGTFSQPWRTFEKAASIVIPGDTVYVRGGIYHESITLNHSGTEHQPIRFTAYGSENPVIDGNNDLPTSWTGLITVKGDWVRISGFEVRNSAYIGVQLQGKHNLADYIFAHHNQRNGIYAQGDYGMIENSRIWRNALVNENNKAGNGSSALTTSRDIIDGVTDYAILRNNTVWENWAIGIDSYESNGILIEGNTVHDNLIGNIYISDATNIRCNRNFFYMSPGSITYGLNSNFGILLGDEIYQPASANIIISNNIAYGNNLNLKWYSGVQGGGMNNVLIANNTFVNNMANQKGNMNVDIGAGPHQNVRILNNIIIQDDSQAIEDITINPQIILSNNLWSKSPRSANLGTNSLVADPKITRTGLPNGYEWFQLTAQSPAINHALVLPEIDSDYRSTPRGLAPDMGALEYQ